MKDVSELFPRRYSLDLSRRRIMVGLTAEETSEFERLDNSPPLDENGSPAWTFDGVPSTPRERRWLELYRKHEQAWDCRRRSLFVSAEDTVTPLRGANANLLKQDADKI